MRYINFFFELGNQAILAGVLLTPLFALVAIAGLAIAAWSASRNLVHLSGKWVWLCIPLIIPVIILMYGVAFNYQGRAGSAPHWRTQVVYALLLAHIPIMLGLLVLFRRAPIVVLGLSVFQFWLSFSTAIMAQMSATNSWL